MPDIVLKPGQVNPTDVALVRSGAYVEVTAVGQTLENDLAQAVASIHLVLVNQITEIDLAQVAKPLHIKSAGQTTETELAQVVKALHIKSVGQALETDLAQHVSETQRVTESQATETDLAQQAKPLHLKSVTQPLETDLAQNVTAKHIKGVGQALETDLAQPTTVKHVKSVGQSTETETAQAVAILQQGPRNVALFVPQIELPFEFIDWAFDAYILTSTAPQIIDVGQANENDDAQAVGFINVIPVPQRVLGGGGFRFISKEKQPKKPRPLVVAVGLAQEFDSTTRVEIKRIFRPVVVPKFAEPYFYTTSVESIQLEENELELVLAGVI